MAFLLVNRPLLGSKDLLNGPSFIEGPPGLSLGLLKLPGGGDELGFGIQAQRAGAVAALEAKTGPFTGRPAVALAQT